MAYSRTFKGVIWTNHALERLKGRKMPQELAWKTLAFPDKKANGKKKGSFEFTKNFGDRTVTVVANRTQKNEWLVVSSWIDPPLSGSVDLVKNKESVFVWLLKNIFSRLFGKKIFKSKRYN